MKAILDRDIILSLTRAPEGVEIGAIPPGVGLDRLRFDGEKLVDLIDLERMWVEPVPGGGFILHAIEVPGSVRVDMRFADRKKLIREASGIIRLQTEAELAGSAALDAQKAARTSLLSSIASTAGTPQEQIHQLRKLVFLLIFYVLTDNAAARTLLTELLAEVRDNYTPDQLRAELKALAASLKEAETAQAKA